VKMNVLPALALAAAAAFAPVLLAVGPGKPADPPCSGLTTYLATLPVEPLSDAEKAGLLFTREEEKLARDVYVAMAAKWGDRAFTNIAASEQQHMDAVLFLLQRYGLADPAAGNAPGVFANERLAALYVALVEKGSASLVGALTAGATIEDLDLADVEDLLAAADNVDVDTVMQNLAKGSRNHLRSFVSLLEAQGASYVPQYIDTAEYEAILATDPEIRVVYDAAGAPVEGITARACAGTGAPRGKWTNSGAPAGTPGGTGTGTGTCDGTGSTTAPAGSGSSSGNGGKP